MARRRYVSDDEWDNRYKMAREGAYEGDPDPPGWYCSLRGMHEAKLEHRRMERERDPLREELTLEES